MDGRIDMGLIEYLRDKAHEVYRKHGYPECGEYDGGYCHGYSQAVEDVENHSDWIPANNTPEDTREVMLSLKRGDSKTVTIGSYSFKRQKYILTNKKIANDWQVVAWAEKPEPYKGE